MVLRLRVGIRGGGPLAPAGERLTASWPRCRRLSRWPAAKPLVAEGLPAIEQRFHRAERAADVPEARSPSLPGVSARRLPSAPRRAVRTLRSAPPGVTNSQRRKKTKFSPGLANPEADSVAGRFARAGNTGRRFLSRSQRGGVRSRARRCSAGRSVRFWGKKKYFFARLWAAISRRRIEAFRSGVQRFSKRPPFIQLGLRESAPSSSTNAASVSPTPKRPWFFSSY